MSAVYGNMNRLTNVVQLTNAVATASAWHSHDSAGRLGQKGYDNGDVVTQAQYWYDAHNRRVAKAERVGGAIQRWLYLYDGWDTVAVMNEAGQLRETFTRGVGLAGDIGTLVAVTHHAGSSTNGVFYAHHNHRGDITLARAGTATVGRYGYSAFGILHSAPGPDVCRFKFSSKERDAATGFSYYGYRFYAPQWQRWPNRDPIGEDGGMNPFAFVVNNPVRHVDPDGKAPKQVPKKEPPPQKSPAKPKCTRCEDLVNRLNKIKDRTERAGDENWKADCYQLCAHIHGDHGAAVKKCYERCEEGKPPSISCFFAVPEGQRPGPRK